MKDSELVVARAQAMATLLTCARDVEGIPILSIIQSRVNGRTVYALACIDGMSNANAAELLRMMANLTEEAEENADDGR